MAAKWKTFPCKECIINKICDRWCFDWPVDSELMNHIEKNQLKNICLGCGDSMNHDWPDQVVCKMKKDFGGWL